MTEHAVLDSLHRGVHLAVAIAPNVDSRLAWVGVYVLDLHRDGTRIVLRRLGVSIVASEEPLYRIRAFEVATALIDADACISEEELTERCDAIAVGDDELRRKLAELGVRLEQLELPFRSNYPI